EAYRDGVAVRPVGDFAGRDHGARVALAADLDRDVEIDLLAPGQRRGGERQRRGNRFCRRRIERLGIERDRAEIKADAHENPPWKNPPRRSAQRPACFKVLVSSPARLNAAIASFAVTATVVFISLMLPPAAPAMASASAALLSGHSAMVKKSSSPNVR